MAKKNGMSKKEIENQTREKIIKLYEMKEKGEISEQAWRDYIVNLLGNYINKRIGVKNILKTGTYLTTYEDCYQNAVMGVLENIHKYDPHISMPTSFFTEFIDEYIRKTMPATKLTSEYYETTENKANSILREEGYTGIMDPMLDNVTIHALTGISLKTIEQIKELNKGQFVSLDDEDMKHIESMSDYVPEKHIIKEETNKFLREQLSKLTPLERFVLAKLQIGDDITTIRKLVGILNESDEFLDERNKTVNQLFIEEVHMRALLKIQNSPRTREMLNTSGSGNTNINFIPVSEEEEYESICESFKYALDALGEEYNEPM